MGLLSTIKLFIRAQLSATSPYLGGGTCEVDFAEVVCIAFKTPAANPGTISIKPGAANSWLALLPNASDIITLLPGTTLVLFCPAATAYAMGASTDRINVTSSSGTSSVQITVIGRSA